MDAKVEFLNFAAVVIVGRARKSGADENIEAVAEGIFSVRLHEVSLGVPQHKVHKVMLRYGRRQ